MPILSAIGAGFGSDEVTPRYLAPSLTKPLARLGKQALSSLGTGASAAEQKYNLGTARQESLMGEQEGVVRNLLSRALNQDPTRLLQDVGRTAFSFIDPNVVSPLSRFDVNYDRLGRMARGLNPAAVDSTSERLRNARIASGRYYDVARNIYGQLPQLYNQVFNAGLSNADLAAGYIPGLMRGYRNLDTAPLEAAQLVSNAANLGSQNVGNINNALRSGVYGYQQQRNIWDRLGAVDTSMWNSLKDAVQMAASVYGGLLGGGAGGGLLGGLGGGMGGPSGQSAPQQGVPRFIPYNPQAPQAPQAPPANYPPWPYDVPQSPGQVTPQQQGWFPG